MRRGNWYHILGLIVLAATLTLIVLDFNRLKSAEGATSLLIQYALFIFIGLMLILIGELVKKLTIFESNLENINKILFPDRALDGIKPDSTAEKNPNNSH